jgi:hypothetical protein
MITKSAAAWLASSTTLTALAGVGIYQLATSPAAAVSNQSSAVSGGSSAGAQGNGNGNGNGNAQKPSPSPAAEPPGKSLTFSPAFIQVSGLAPGISKPITLTVINPNNQDVVLQAVTAVMTSPSPGPTDPVLCSSPADVTIQVRSGQTPVDVKKNGKQDVLADVLMNNSTTRNQQDCKGKRFTFSFSATATSK